MPPQRLRASIASFPRGKVVYTSSYLLVKAEPRHRGHVRFGVLVAKAVSKKATLRNAIKRKTRQTLSEFRDMGAPYDIWCTVRPAFLLLGRHAREGELRRMKDAISLFVRT